VCSGEGDAARDVDDAGPEAPDPRFSNHELLGKIKQWILVVLSYKVGRAGPLNEAPTLNVMCNGRAETDYWCGY
jgi:hypothetical protein